MLKRLLPVGFFLAALLVFGQTSGSKVEFEVASIRSAEQLTLANIQSGKMRVGMNVDGARAEFGFLSLRELIPAAFKMKPHQISGPDWLGSQRFDILAKLPEGANKDQVPEMLQALLAERFKLTFHREMQERPVYALVVAKGGHKLKEAIEEETSAKAPTGAAAIGTVNGQQMHVTTNAQGAAITGGPNGPMRMTMSPGGTMRMDMSKVSMPAFADMLIRFTDRPVIDKTELTGNYQVALEVRMDEMLAMARASGVLPNPGVGALGAVTGGRPADTASDPSGGAIFKAVQDLGLRLEARKAPIEILVIDHVEKNPTDN